MKELRRKLHRTDSLRQIVLIWLFFSLFLEGRGLSLLYAQSKEGEKENRASQIEQKRRDTILYGTEEEIAALIPILQKEGVTYLDNELIRIGETTKNVKIQTALFSFFSDANKKGLEKKALEIIDNFYDEKKETVIQALTYLGVRKEQKALEGIKKIVDAEESNLVGPAIQALGSIGSESEQKEALGRYLREYYETKASEKEEIKNQIVRALGVLKDKSSASFISDIAKNNDERPARRIQALEALQALKEQETLSAILEALRSSDPNVRAAAVGALGPFSGRDVDQAILDAFRDSFYKTRMGAARAAGDRKLIAAIPFLRFRIENDGVAAVKEASIKALGAIESPEAQEVLSQICFTKKYSDPLRIGAAEELIRIDPDRYAEPLIKALEEARKEKQKNLFNGFARVLGTAKTQVIKSLARQFLTSSDVIEKSYGLQMVANNRFTDLADAVRSLTDEKNGALALRARDTLKKLEE
ncbi:MAG: HEAT repeat domain-containing protein [Treponemataceae bacterium]|nr:HEAT repeat domain-containing protein [Treponemataceae bacterium]